MEQIRLRSSLVDKDAFPIKFKNGYLDTDGEFVEFEDYSAFTPYYINTPYLEDAEPVEIVDEYLNHLCGNDPEYIRLIKQVLGYSLVTDSEKVRVFGKFFMFRGDGRNGKGTLLQIIQSILNKRNCSNMSIKQMADPRYQISMIGKLANLGDDIEPDTINNDQMKMLKNITTADDIEGRHMYHESESMRITAKMYFTTNADIKTFEKGYAYARRVLWLPMFTKVEKVDPKFISKITTQKALEYWVRLIVEGYKDLLQDGWYICDTVKKYNEEYHENNNAMLLFVKDFDFDPDFVGKTMGEVKQMYNPDDYDTRPFQPKLFKQAMWDINKAGFGRKLGLGSRILMKQSETSQDLRPK